MGGSCSKCNAWDDDVEYRGGICECCYLGIYEESNA